MNDMENNNMAGSLENNHLADETAAADPEEAAAGPAQESQAYQYQPPVNRQAPPSAGYPFAQQPMTGAGQIPPQGPNFADQWNFPEYGGPQKPPKKKKGKGLKIFAGIVGALLGVTVLSFAVFGIYSLVVPQQNVVEPPAQSQNKEELPANENVPELQTNSKPSDNTISTDGTLTTAQINEKVAPSVVGIVQYQSNYFEPTGEGSGIILSEDGYIATNAHVIEGADSLEVVLSDGMTYQ